MTIHNLNDLHTPIGDVLQLAGTEGVLVQPPGESTFAIMPLDDELLDFLVERNPRFIEECQQIRDRMASSSSHSQAEINSLFGRGGS